MYYRTISGRQLPAAVASLWVDGGSHVLQGSVRRAKVKIYCPHVLLRIAYGLLGSNRTLGKEDVIDNPAYKDLLTYIFGIVGRQPGATEQLLYGEFTIK